MEPIQELWAVNLWVLIIPDLGLLTCGYKFEKKQKKKLAAVILGVLVIPDLGLLICGYKLSKNSRHLPFG